VRFDKNDYSIPHTAVRRMLTIFATHQQVRVMQDSTELVVHERSYDQGITVENPAHIEALRTEKRLAREPVRLRHLTTAAPAAEAFLKRIGAKGGAMGASLMRMERMLDLFGPAALQVALVEAERIPVATIHDVHMLLDQRDRQLSNPPPTGIHLPHDSPLRALSVTPHSLASYDTLNLKSED
jgi:transcriptional regulator of met regulon